ncbi:endonuclease/exonuclease/phosphatase family protein [Terrabacter sp. LjRoot27]|uniref:endonuclease/exonuclease/phosphatase family protein n=1 Tax=Terrabacter sp. LjRoot27 TaxID=3342306 RepID=UPI003ED06C31
MTAPAHPSTVRRWAAGALWLFTLGSLGLCLALTVPRIFDVRPPRVVELAALSPLGTVFSLLTVAGAGALSLVRSVPGWRAARWGVLVGTFLLAIHLAWLAPFYTGSSPSSGSGSQFVVLAQNFEYGDPTALARAAKREGADILVLSDVPPSQLAALRNTDIPSTYPFQVGVGPDGPDGTLVLSRHQLLGDTPISDGADSRLVRVVLPEIGTVDLVAVHITPPYQGDAWARDYAQLEDFLSKRYGDDARRPVVMAGDFNASRDNAPFRRLLDRGFEEDMDQTNGGYQPTWPADGSRRLFGLQLPALVRIDHTLVSQALVAGRAKTIHIAESDHNGVVLHFRSR